MKTFLLTGLTSLVVLAVMAKIIFWIADHNSKGSKNDQQKHA